MLYDHCTRVTHVLHVGQIACSNALKHAYHRDQLLELSGYCPACSSDLWWWQFLSYIFSFTYLNTKNGVTAKPPITYNYNFLIN